MPLMYCSSSSGYMALNALNHWVLFVYSRLEAFCMSSASVHFPSLSSNWHILCELWDLTLQERESARFTSLHQYCNAKSPCDKREKMQYDDACRCFSLHFRSLLKWLPCLAMSVSLKWARLSSYNGTSDSLLYLMKPLNI